MLAPFAHGILARPGGGHRLLAELSRYGWYVGIVADGEGGLRISARHPSFGSVEDRFAHSASEVALEIFEEALALSGRGPLQ